MNTQYPTPRRERPGVLRLLMAARKELVEDDYSRFDTELPAGDHERRTCGE